MIQYVPPVTYVDKPEEMMKFVRHVRDTGECAMDTETTGLDRRSDHVILWSACPDEKTRYCFSLKMLDIWDKELAPDPDLKWYFTNQTFDFSMLANSGVHVPEGDSYCTLAMDWLYDENRQGRHGLKETMWDYCAFNMNSFKDTFGGRKRGESLPQRFQRALVEDFEKTVSYASLDAWSTYKVFKHLKQALEKQQSTLGHSLWEHFETYEVPFTRVLHNCCRRGIMIDVGYLDSLAPAIQKDIDKLAKQLAKIAGKEINPNSNKQLRELFFGKLQLKPIKMTKGGDSGDRQPSTDEECLTIWADEGIEAAEALLAYRGLSKFKSTYVEGMKDWCDIENRIHATMTQHVTVTGRLSSVDPNLQNIPRPDNDVYVIRQAFMPRDGYVLVVADYEQLEMRLLAHLAQDPNMIGVINRGWDIHSGSAALMYNHDYDELIAAIKKKKSAAKDPSIKLTDAEKAMVLHRQDAKTIGFGLNYGEGPKKLAKALHCTVDEAKAKIGQYFQPYPHIKQFIDDVHAIIADIHFVETILGRPRRFPEMAVLGSMPRYQMRGSEKANLARNERQSVNSIIQGSAADVAKSAMLKCEYDRQLRNLGVQMLLQIHDELMFEVPEENVAEAMPVIRDHMEHALPYELSVPLGVDMGAGYSWNTAKA